MKDKEFLQWIHDRLVDIHGEDPDFDYMHKLKSIIDNMKVSNGIVIECGSEGHAYEDATDGCYSCIFGDDFGMSDCNFCIKCKLESWKFYTTKGIRSSTTKENNK